MHSRRGGGTTLSEPFDFGLSSEPKRARRCAAPRPAGPGRSDSGRAADLAPHRAKQNEQGNRRRIGPEHPHRGQPPFQHRHQTRPPRHAQPDKIRLRPQIGAVLTWFPLAVEFRCCEDHAAQRSVQAMSAALLFEAEPMVHPHVLEAYEQAIRVLRKARIPYRETGGIALYFYGAGRPTKDVDLIVRRADWLRPSGHWGESPPTTHAFVSVCRGSRSRAWRWLDHTALPSNSGRKERPTIRSPGSEGCKNPGRTPPASWPSRCKATPWSGW